MKRKLWRAAGCVLMLCLLAASLDYFIKLMEHKDSVVKYQPFFEQEADFDVLFLGTSHVMNGVFPMELWNDYGIVSYNFGGHVSYMPLTYWAMENALDYTTPKLIVVDCFMLGVNAKTPAGYSFVHQSLDAFPLSVTKINAVQDLLNDPVMSGLIEDGTVIQTEKRIPIGLLWDFSVYHSRWNELEEDDFQVAASYEKGAESRIAVAVPQVVPKVGRNEKLEGNTVGIEYLRKIIEKCQNRGIDILLTYLPYPADASGQEVANRVYDIAEAYGSNYINFLDMDIVDYETDCYDSDSHLNPSGARKVTDYLGKYIMEHYQIVDQRGNPDYSDWFEDYEAYKAMKVKNLQAQGSWDAYLMLLADKNLDVIIEIRNPDMWNNSKFVNLVENLGIDMQDVPETANFLLIRGDRQTEVLLLDTNTDTRMDTAMGLLCVSHDESGTYGVYLNDTECFPPSWSNVGNIAVYVRDSESLNTMGQRAF